jgi:hypothetical protein
VTALTVAVSAEFRAVGASGRAGHRSTPQNPRNSGSGKAEFTFDTDQGTVCYEIEAVPPAEGSLEGSCAGHKITSPHTAY